MIAVFKHSIAPPKLGNKHQQGVVLVIVIMAVSLMLILLAVMIEDQHLLTRRVANQKMAEQGYQYSQGLTAWAARVLHEDSNRQVDFWDEDWAKFGRPDENENLEDQGDGFSLDSSISNDEEEQAPTIDFGIDDMEYSIVDLQGKFNLNNLANTNQEFVNGQRRIFLNLLELLELGEFDQREQMVDSLIDWVDENDTNRAYGAESNDYRVLDTPYLAADQKLSSLGELRFVQGFSSDIIRELAPYVTVLPVDNARLNINTVKTEVLASLSGAAITDIGPVEAFLAARQQPGFPGFQGGQVEEAKTAILGVSLVGAQPVPNMMQVNSQFFQINNKVVLGDYQFCTKTIVLRKNNNVEDQTKPSVDVLSREYDSLCLDPIPANNSNNETVSAT